MARKNNWQTVRKAAAATLGTAVCAVLSLLLLAYFKLPVFWVVPVAAAMVFLLWKTYEVRELRVSLFCAAFSSALALSIVAGGKFRPGTNTLEPFYRSDLMYLAALAAVLFIVLTPAAQALVRRPLRPAPVLSGIFLRPGAVWALAAVFLFLCWIPCLVVYYPGSISPDSLACIVRADGRAGLSNQQPVFYTLLMRPFLLFAQAIGRSLNFGCALFLLVQAAAMAVMLGYVPAWLLKRGCPRWAALLCVAFFTLNPAFPMYSVTMWKDILFTGLMTLYVLNLYDIIQSKGDWFRSRRNLIWFLALNFLIAFFRNNGFYVIAVTLVLLVFLYWKSWKRLVPGFLAVLILVPVVQGPVYRLCGIAPSPFAESVGIPLQQISYTVTYGGKVTAEQRDFLNRMLPYDEIKAAYTPYSSNGIKFHKDFNNDFLEKNKGTFLRVWAQMFAHNFSSYVKAYIMETVGYWHIGTKGWVLYYGTNGGYGAEETGLSLSSSSGGHAAQLMRDNIRTSFPFFQDQMQPLSLLLNIAFLFWATVFAALVLALKKGGRYLLVFLPMLLLWATLMIAAPTNCEFRYMFTFTTALPAFLAMPFLRRPAAAARR